MMAAQRQQRLVVEWSVAGAALDGGESGDVHVVAGFPHGVLVAVIDGLGHGSEAAAAANAAARVLEQAAGESVIELVERCHEALRNTRGAVMSIASFDSRDASMVWTAVGNVEGILLRANPAAQPAREFCTSRGGVVGYQIPATRAKTLSVEPGDMLVMVSDGIRSGFAAALRPRGSPQAIADSILAQYARGTDDALVVVARYLGASP